MGKFNVIGIVSPGKVNVKLNGRFVDVELFNASEEELEQLYNDKCPYVELSPEEFIARNPQAKEIRIKPVNVSRKNNTTSPD